MGRPRPACGNGPQGAGPQLPGRKPSAEQVEDSGHLASGVGDDPGDEIAFAAAGQEGAARVAQEFCPEQRPICALAPGPCPLPDAQFAGVSDRIPAQAGIARPGRCGAVGDPFGLEQQRQALSSQVKPGKAVLDRVTARRLPGRHYLRRRNIREQADRVQIELQVMARTDPQPGAEHSRVAVGPADSIAPQRVVGHRSAEQCPAVHTTI